MTDVCMLQLKVLQVCTISVSAETHLEGVKNLHVMICGVGDVILALENGKVVASFPGFPPTISNIKCREARSLFVTRVYTFDIRL